jgi:acyl-CoA reductase-like NAD-dependent aldehyde dehydrogenase
MEPLFCVKMGTVISHASKDRIGQMVDASVEEGAKVLTGGNCPGEAGVFCPG